MALVALIALTVFTLYQTTESVEYCHFKDFETAINIKCDCYFKLNSCPIGYRVPDFLQTDNSGLAADIEFCKNNVAGCSNTFSNLCCEENTSFYKKGTCNVTLTGKSAPNITECYCINKSGYCLRTTVVPKSGATECSQKLGCKSNEQPCCSTGETTPKKIQGTCNIPIYRDIRILERQCYCEQSRVDCLDTYNVPEGGLKKSCSKKLGCPADYPTVCCEKYPHIVG